MGRDDWDSFDFEAWGIEDTADGTGGNRDATVETAGDDVEEKAGGEASGWASYGGVLRWMEPEGEDSDKGGDPRSEARSRWASDSIDIPPGAPDYLRLRSLRAWLLRKRLLETEAIGQLLLERRRQEADTEISDDAAPPATEADDSPLELELVARQAAIEVYEALVESLDEMITHSGPARILVEFYLWLSERLALLASAAPPSVDVASYGIQPPFLGDRADIASAEDAPARQGPATARGVAEWQGQARAALQARRRIEQVSQPEPED